MPELPEVEITRRGLAPHLEGLRLAASEVRQPRLRWPVAAELGSRLPGQRLLRIQRRAKYLLLEFTEGTLLLHLGMSGSLRILPTATPPGPHDHVDLLFEGGRLLRLTDPRRFGAVLWAGEKPQDHALLKDLGPEPLSGDFHAEDLYRTSRGRKLAIKNFIMDAHQVVGVGNIYASESLFLAGIHPSRAAGRIALKRYAVLVGAIQRILAESIEQGGTTLRDFVGSDGRPGYFQRSLHVYGRAGQACGACGETLQSRVIGQRSSFFCSHCQR